jgi:hypothetical protein
VPDELVFAIKPQLAAAMLARARAQDLPARWADTDEVYGGVDLRGRMRELGFDYAVAVPASHRVTTPAGRFDAVGVLAKLPRRAGQRIRTGHATKGDRRYDWAMIEVSADGIPPGHGTRHSFLLVRCHRYTRELSFHRCRSTTPVTLADLVDVICCRWRVEEGIQTAKSPAGLDQGQATCWNSWMRWSLISLVVAALLAVAARHPGDDESGEHEPMIALTRLELVWLPRAFVLPQPVTGARHVLHWSHRRRRHQHRRYLPPLLERGSRSRVITNCSCRVRSTLKPDGFASRKAGETVDRRLEAGRDEGVV